MPLISPPFIFLMVFSLALAIIALHQKITNMLRAYLLLFAPSSPPFAIFRSALVIIPRHDTPPLPKTSFSYAGRQRLH